MKFMPRGQKVKELRRILGLKQKDLVELMEGEITREFISMVEKEKRHFKKQTAIKVMSCMLDYAKEQGIYLNLDEEYLIRDEVQEAERYCDLCIAKDLDFDACLNLLDICEEFGLGYTKYKIYKIMGDIKFKANDYKAAFIYYSTAYEVLSNYEENSEKPIILNNMGVCKLKLLKYDEAILYFNNSLMACNTINRYDCYDKIIYNLILCYSELNKYEDALSIIKKFSERIEKLKEELLYIKIKISEANCYEAKGEYDKCIDIYHNLRDELGDSVLGDMLGNIYNNLALVYLKKKDYEKSEEYFSKCIEFRKEKDNKHLCRVLIHKSNFYLDKGMKEEATKIIDKAIELCKLNNDFKYLIIALKNLEKIYKINEDNINLRNVYLEILNIAKENKSSNEIVYALNNLVDIEITLQNYDKAHFYNKELKGYLGKFYNII